MSSLETVGLPATALGEGSLAEMYSEPRYHNIVLHHTCRHHHFSYAITCMQITNYTQFCSITSQHCQHPTQPAKSYSPWIQNTVKRFRHHCTRPCHGFPGGYLSANCLPLHTQKCPATRLYLFIMLYLILLYLKQCQLLHNCTEVKKGKSCTWHSSP